MFETRERVFQQVLHLCFIHHRLQSQCKPISYSWWARGTLVLKVLDGTHLLEWPRFGREIRRGYHRGSSATVFPVWVALVTLKHFPNGLKLLAEGPEESQCIRMAQLKAAYRSFHSLGPSFLGFKCYVTSRDDLNDVSSGWYLMW